MMMMMREKTTTSKRTTTSQKKSVPPKRALSPAVAVLVSSLASPKRVVFVVCTKGSRDNFVSNSNELFEVKTKKKSRNETLKKRKFFLLKFKGPIRCLKFIV